MDIIRQVDIFNNDNELLVEEIQIEYFELEIFKERFQVTPDDPSMYAPYEITTETIDLFPSIKFNFQKFSYFLGCYQV